MSWIKINIEKLVPAAWNYKKGLETDTDDEHRLMREALKNNIKRNGQIENVLVRELDSGFYEVVNGNHRYEVFRDLGITEVMTFNLGKISDAAAMRVAVETNETKFAADSTKLAQRLEEIKAEFPEDELRGTLPFSEEQLNSYKALLDFSWESLDGAGPSGGGSDGEPNGEAPGKPYEETKRTVFLRLDPEVADMLEFQVKRIKKLLYPEELPERVADSDPIQAIIQIIAETEDARFSSRG